MANYLIDHNNSIKSNLIEELNQYFNLKTYLYYAENQLNNSYNLYSSLEIANDACLDMMREKDIDNLRLNEEIKIRKLKNKCVQAYKKSPQAYQKYKYYSMNLLPLSCHRYPEKFIYKDDVVQAALEKLSKRASPFTETYNDTETSLKPLLNPSLNNTNKSWSKKCMKRRRIFTAIAKKEVPKLYKSRMINKTTKLRQLKKVAYECARQYKDFRNQLTPDDNNLTFDTTEFSCALSITIEDPQESLLLKETRLTCLQTSSD